MNTKETVMNAQPTPTTTPTAGPAGQPVLDVIAILAAIQDQLDDLTAAVRAHQARLDALTARLDGLTVRLDRGQR